MSIFFLRFNEATSGKRHLQLTCIHIEFFFSFHSVPAVPTASKLCRYYSKIKLCFLLRLLIYWHEIMACVNGLCEY